MCPWSSVEVGQNVKENDKTAFFSPSEYGCLPASTLKLEEREFVVDCRASIHMISKKDLNSAESKFCDAWRENCFCCEQDHPEFPLQEKWQPRGAEGPKKGPVSSRKTDRLHDWRQLSSHWCSWYRSRLRWFILCYSSWWQNWGIRYKMGWSSIVHVKKISSDDILESLYKFRIRESDQLKTVLELYDMPDGTVKLSGGDQVLRTSTLIRDDPDRWEEQGNLLGEPEGSLPPHHDSLPDAGEAINDFWSMWGNFIYRHHVEPRVKLYSPREEWFPIPLRYIDVTRATSTTLDVMLESGIDDYWNIEGDRHLSDSWTGSIRFTMLDEKPPDGNSCSG